MNDVNNNIRKLRKEKNMTQAELAEKMNVSEQLISNWESGEDCPDVEALKQLAEVFDVTVERIIYGKRNWYITYNPNPQKRIQECVNLGAIIAAVISYVKWQSIGWAILHGTFGWGYVIYYIIKYLN